MDPIERARNELAQADPLARLAARRRAGWGGWRPHLRVHVF